jgi:prolyl 4-hydroxylase
MSVLDRAQRLKSDGKPAEAVALVEKAASEGDGEALHAIAHWRLFGMGVKRDPEAAHALLEKAGAAGWAEAIRTRAILIANGTGCPGDPERARALMASIAPQDPVAARQIAFLPRMMSADAAMALLVDTLCEDPIVRAVRGLLLPDECRYLMERAEPLLQPSFIVDPATGKRGPHPVRTSAGMNFGPTEEDLVVHALNLRLAAITGTDVACGELLHILRYAPGQEYRPHVDILPNAQNQRRWTVLAYLNSGYSGGETLFDRLGISFRGEAGDALVFRNLTSDGAGDFRTRHAGLPVTDGVKWLASRWIRQHPYSPWDA